MTRRALAASALIALALLAGCSDDDEPSAGRSGTASPSAAAAPDGPTVTVSKGGNALEDGCRISSCAKVRVELTGFEPEASLRVACQGPSGTILDYAVTTDAQGASTSEECYFAFPGQVVTASVGEVTSEELVWPDAATVPPTSPSAPAPTPT